MRYTWLGWAGMALEHDGAVLVIDPLRDGAATFADVPEEQRRGVRLPAVTDPPAGAVGALVTHLHRDHTDAQALSAALAPGAPLLGPNGAAPPGQLADAGLVRATGELAAAGLRPRPVGFWEKASVGPFTVTALPAVDGLGDPQVSWLVEAGGQRVFHGGDTMFHGWWWRIAEACGPLDAAFLPINGAVLSFPFRRPASPLPAVMNPEQAVAAGAALRARTVVPIHYGAFELEPFYRPVDEPLPRFQTAAQDAGVSVVVPEVGSWLEL